MKKIIMAATVAMLAVGAVGCGGGGGGGTSDPYWHAWYDVYGQYCYTGYPQPGCNFYSDGYKIIDSEDPYYSQYNLEYGSWSYVDSYGYTQYYTGWAWLSPNGILYDDYGYALNEEGQKEGRDILGQVAEAETSKITEAGKGFAEKFALSEETGIRISQSLHDAAVGRKAGVRTEADYAAITNQLFGVDQGRALAEAKKAANGDMSGIETINAEVAQSWGTDPATSKKIAKTWFAKEIKKYSK